VITLAAWLVGTGASIMLMLGLLHLLYTFRGPRLRPRDAALETRMKEVNPVLTSQTTMWKSWVGFNASHSLGAIFFGLMYTYLALVHGILLFASPFLLLTGSAMLLAYAVLGKRYWFSVPYRCILAAAAFYAAGLVAARI
jgi:hypothetical protein